MDWNIVFLRGCHFREAKERRSLSVVWNAGGDAVLKGSMTIEAACLFPFCFAVLGVVCLLGIFQYNTAVLKITGYECIFHSMEERELSETVFQKNLLERAERIGMERTLCVENLCAELKMTDTQILLSYSGTQRLLKVPIEVTMVYQRTYPERILRITGN